ncbi:MAG: hypothetical protein SCJ97_01735 [Bacillota bacterium]|nr:hypothetical protein [Bacillota bacterium]
MQVTVTVNRGLHLNGKPVNFSRKKQEMEFTGTTVLELMIKMGLDPEQTGLILINGRTVLEPEEKEVNLEDHLEFYPLMMGG